MTETGLEQCTERHALASSRPFGFLEESVRQLDRRLHMGNHISATSSMGPAWIHLSLHRGAVKG